MQQRSLVLILARDLADKLASAVFVVDAAGRIVYFNEHAADILGRTYADIGASELEDVLESFSPIDFDGTRLSPADMPVAITLQRQRPSHRAFRIERADGETRDIEVTALPLFAHREEFVGAAAIFWEQQPEDAAPGAGD